MPASTHPPVSSNRETLLCIHGSAATGRSWNTIAAVLGARFDVVTPDRLGCARDACWSAGTPASFEAEARHLASWLCPQGAHVLAHSYGAAIALELALRWPHRVRSLTLFEPARFALLFDESEPVEERDEILRTGGLVSLWVKAGRLGDAAQMFVDYWSGRGAWDALDERQQHAVRACMPKVAVEFEAAFADRAPLHAFERLTMPARLLAGEESPAPTRRIARTLARLMPAADLVELPGLGHMGPVTHPHELIDNLPAWLTTAERRLVA
jgi:pimeloyl-ACP methyl ester carboxylesterase